MLNEMCGGHHTMHAGRASLSQTLVMGHVSESVRSLGSPPSDADGRRVTGRAALHELLAKQGYGGGATVDLDINLLSLPSVDYVPVALPTLMGPGGNSFVQEFVSSAVLPKMAARAKIADSGLKTAYMDPSLRGDPVRYGRLLERLRAPGMIEYRTSGMPAAVCLQCTRRGESSA